MMIAAAEYGQRQHSYRERVVTKRLHLTVGACR